ncbi:MAG: hypothetical protein EAZ30_02630 [Betaproteobacteria bacterium]|nr:MAG: hypothetical protein EAZ30_02630 [Betaproteobacteria bacterium]
MSALQENRIDTSENTEPVSGQSRWVQQLFELLGERYVLFYPKLAHQLGDAKSALFIARVLTWTRITQQRSPSLDGWVWPSAERLAADTGLSPWEQRTARKRLTTEGILEEKKAGMPARLHFRLNLNTLARRLVGQNETHWSWQPDLMRSILGVRPIAVHQSLIRLTGDSLTALYLSQLIGWTRAALIDGKSQVPTTLRGKRAWFDVGIEALRDKLHMSRKVQIRCRERLIALNFISEDYTSGLSPRLLTAVKLDEIASRLAALPQDATNATTVAPRASDAGDRQISLDLPRGLGTSSSPQIERKANEYNSFAKRDTPVCWKPANKDAENQQTGVSLSSQQECPVPHSRSVPNLQACAEERVTTPTVLREERSIPLHLSSSIAETVTPLRPAGRRRISFEMSGLKSLSPRELVEVDRLAQHAGEQGQQLLDELAFALTQNTQRPVNNPVAYVNRLLSKAIAGSFVPAGALRIAAKREREISQQAQAERARAAESQRSLPEAQARSRAVAIEAIAAAKLRLGSRGRA